MKDTVGYYLDRIGKIPMLTAAEEIHQGQLIRAWQDHEGGPDAAPARIIRRGQRAVRRFVEGNLRLVISIAKKNELRGKTVGLDLIDLIQEGNIGLNTAVHKFDPERGYKFSTYAYWWIIQSVGRAIESGNIIRLPYHILQQANRLKRVASEMPDKSFEDICKTAKLAPARARFIMASDHLKQVASLDADVRLGAEFGSCPMGELLSDKSQTNPLEVLPFEEIIAKVREQLPDEFALIQLHLECMNKEDISHLLGISRQQTRTELNNARMKLQKEFTLKGARELLAA